ncbi:hypothetical protein PCC6912_52520 [Chlorogloeopsis fritschii PCC 6912]|uniref:Uncharacterized protein n=1 Tax=Chlorogloeopsis fritschii PCC 6912 TaxID=211165 RepID=A0A3S0ZP74_CHLFR|nr:hypothetical protein PCC6912_52520 [Chlorogloeopsis fritschii PCC 6912]
MWLAIALPENKPGSIATVELGISFKNNTSSPLPFRDLVPELVAPDGQTLKPQEPGTKGNKWGLITRGLPVGITLLGRISWRNNSLQLEIPTYWHYLEASPITPENYWNFDSLQPGIYKLRFICDIPSREAICSNPETRHLAELKENNIANLTTPFVNLRLVQPLEHNKTAVEVDGIRFETLVPKQELNIPKKEPGAKAGLQLAGIRMTNNRLNPVCFSFYVTVIPEILGTNSQRLFRGGFSDWFRQAEKSDFVLAMPGEDVTFFPGTAIWWQQNDKILLVIDAQDGGAYTFEFFDSGTYKIQLNYVNIQASIKAYDQEDMNWKQIEDVWTGMVITPFVDFKLTRS